MIPEPDYSNSSDENEDVSDDDEESSSSSLCNYPFDNRSADERLRDLTEVYVKNVEIPKSKPSKPIGKKKNPPGSQAKAPVPVSKNKQDAKSSKSPPGTKTTQKSPNATKSTKTEIPKNSSKKPVAKTITKTEKNTTKATDTKGKPVSSKAGDKPKTQLETKKKNEITKRTPASTLKPATEKKSPSTRKNVTIGVSTDPKETEGKPSPTAKKKVGAAEQTTLTKTKSGTKDTATGKTPTPRASPAGDAKSKPTKKLSENKIQKSSVGDTKDTTSEKDKTETKTLESEKAAVSDQSKSPTSGEQSEDEEAQLIKPKKPLNPYLSSTERLKLHKELKFNQKYGKLGTSQKTELQLALEKYTENKERREMLAEEKSSLEKILEIQARKIEMQETTYEYPSWMDRLQKPPALASDPKTDEFFRVHAKVVSNNPLTQCFLNSEDESEEMTSVRKVKNVDFTSES